MSALALVLDALACPVCAQPFALPDAVAPALVCPSRHTFNLARAGYASLVRGGAPRHAADSVAMVQARASFLARGHYQPIAAPVAEAVAEAIGNAESRPDARLAPQRQPAAECETTRRSASNPEPGRGSGLRGRIGEGTPALGFPPLILDLAGGTGYYLAEVLDAIPAARGLVLDLSPAAAKRAARCHPRAGAATADAWERLPLR
ncbi:MAG: hypothetical protein LBC97_08695, partial [Bifidobacteriaceae bacterium]|nr:hypothetical protein [Bifidobacteriaceae bacterium]